MNVTDEQIKAMLGGENASEGTYWNFSNKNGDNFSPVIKGDVVKITCGQEKNWDPATRKFSGFKFWPDGNPRITHVLHIKDANGNVWLHEIKPKSGAMMEDWLPVCPGHNLGGLLGMNIEVEAAQPPINPANGQEIPFSSAMRRTFKVVVVGPGTSQVEGVDMDSYRKIMERKQVSQQPQQPQPQQQAQQMYQQQQVPQMPQSLANAMGAAQQASVVKQAFPGAQVYQQPQAPQPQIPPMDVYDQDIPF